jgi:tetratricopeptide (TPR) repeat protein
MRNLLFPVLTASTIALAQAAPAAAQDNTDQQLGQVSFQTSCNDVAQRRFDRAMRYQHSYWYRQAREIFDEALKADPSCAIAYWGIALGLWDNQHNPPPAPNNAPALEAIRKAQAIGAKTQRERDYIDAMALLYTDHDKTPYRTRLMAHVKAMETLAQRYPQDDEAQIAYAILLNVSAPLNDKTYAQQLKGAAILEPISQRLPLHPGVTHYLIHLYDYPPLAQKGLDAANRYAKVAPAAPHAQHMPSHIYTRVGYWKESIAANTGSVNAAQAHNEGAQALHARDYMVYAHLQLAQDDKARDVIAQILEAAKTLGPTAQGGYFAVAASPARYVIERGDWTGAMALPVRTTRFAHVDAISHFARALGAARAGQPDAAKPDIARLAELRDALRKANDAYWAEQVDIQRQVAMAWGLYAEGKYDEALRAMSAVADQEDKSEKHVVTPGPLAPARELYGYMLLDRGMAREALAAFESTQQKEPNRYHGYAGAALAAERAGDKDKARANYTKLVALAGDADAARPELAAARRYLASN